MSWRNELVTRTEKGKDGEPVMVLIPRVTIVDADKITALAVDIGSFKGRPAGGSMTTASLPEARGS